MRYIKGRWVKAPKGKKRFKIKPLFCLLFIIMLSYAAVSEIALSSATLEITQEAARQHQSVSIADVVQGMSEKAGGFTVITGDNAGKIASIEANTKELNKFKAQLTKAIQKKLNGKASVSVPVGSFTGVSVFNGRGFKVPLKLQFESSVDVSFHSELVSAGINQSCHRIYMTVSVHSVSQSRNFNVSNSYETQFMLSETVIVGQVPEFMLAGDSRGIVED